MSLVLPHTHHKVKSEIYRLRDKPNFRQELGEKVPAGLSWGPPINPIQGRKQPVMTNYLNTTGQGDNFTINGCNNYLELFVEGANRPSLFAAVWILIKVASIQKAPPKCQESISKALRLS